ncbi:hypothetical protein [Romboutsia timonensis]|uniref:hypothetical protein n=1 Tax=Romboutsia timonensis TaxID=1776391 RepID=UPI002A8177D6|nr:hypothetical protein [Romboutsia timonensis]MDY3960055.1 hypothetical protein [Romboutsia timonensis]
MRKLFITISKTILFFVGWAVLVGFTPDIPTDNPAILRLGWEFTPLLTISGMSITHSRFISRLKKAIKSLSLLKKL